MDAAESPRQPQAVALEVLAEALFDCHQRQHGLRPTWATIKEATCEHWRRCVAVAAESAWRSQYSPLPCERLLNAPDPYRVFAMALARSLGAANMHGRSARMARGIQRAIRSAGGEAFSLWVEAIDAGVRAEQARNDVAGSGSNALLRRLPDLRSAA